jgi:hypothetical protein
VTVLPFPSPVTFERCMSDLTCAAGHLERVAGPLTPEQRVRVLALAARLLVATETLS